MAYQKPSQPQSPQGYQNKPAAPVAARPAPAAAQQAAQAPATGGGNRAAFDILLIDAEGNIVKDAEGKAIELGGIWRGKSDTSPLFIKFKGDVAAGTTAKAFAKRPPQQ